ncbi:helix-turn-helix transcriptional regulator [Streptomyces europaeiscabiei]|uniref:helix-turn-helix domain-containing protein n=1 Tax=Streptomyces europaeiscabiei TaxID=146819 RepID=UPI0029AF1815|nr:helix-turn-helix transcriptional regulator [Streptomyces europaeiscabiei]MDX3586123.1 helix-turn-helix transcriptional regulator [Streptomyces europaeiscabiei]MDX3616579.1 helix-turn-helix transcriptional regulator [Streptomyces europaeiscabiei]MDX3633759.1 helix-turn-helix transcriptional regulator [Streptomyces europaeiscabiei]MDX3650942.1 helix-turn-helix transcriptional regulator [Streptomyces europaeiscabiei]WUD34953.1 helix-turn-helix transcriptional regulator [Streptomyces europaeisc
MTPSVDPSLNRRKLRIALRQARDEVGLTQREAAERVEWSQSKLIRIETGAVSISVSDLRALMEIYGITDPTLMAKLEEAARGSKGPSWWSSFHDVLTPQFAQYLGYETAAVRLHTYHPIVIPGHLQTRRYAEALLAPRGLDADRVGRVVDLRMKRQARMFDGEGRLDSVFVLDEAAVRREIGGKEVQAEQLQQLLEFGVRPDVTIRVLPYEAGAHYSTFGSFVLLGFTDDKDLLYLEHAAGSMTGGEDDGLLKHYQDCARRLSDLALDESGSLDLISRVKQDLGMG